MHPPPRPFSCIPPPRPFSCIPPPPAPQIPFKNVFAENVTFSIHCDHAAFAVNKASEVIQAKKAVNFTVTFKAVDDVFPVRGKLIVSCASPGDQDKKVEWVYYLRGLKNEGKEK